MEARAKIPADAGIWPATHRIFRWRAQRPLAADHGQQATRNKRVLLAFPPGARTRRTEVRRALGNRLSAGCVCVCVCVGSWIVLVSGASSHLSSGCPLSLSVPAGNSLMILRKSFVQGPTAAVGMRRVCVGGACSQERCNGSQKCGGTQTPLPPRLVCVNRGRSSEESRDPTSQSSAAVLQCQVRVPLPTRQCSRGLWKPESTQGRGIYRRPRRVASDSQENLDQMDKSK